MKRIKYIILSFTASLACLLSGCGAQEQRQAGIDGFVYTVKTLEEGIDQSIYSRNITAAGDYLYYMDGSRTLKRLPLEEVDSGDFSGGEIVLTAPGIRDAIAKEGETEGNFSGADIRDYAVGSDGSIYCILAVDNSSNSLTSILNGNYNPDEKAEKPRQTSASGLLYKRSSDGETAYWLELPPFRVLQINPDWLAVDSQGTAYVLTAEAVLAVDEKGRITGKLPVTQADSLDSLTGAEGRLRIGAGGQVYYVSQPLASFRANVFRIENNTELRMIQIPLPSVRMQTGLYEGMDCLLVPSHDSLFRYNEADNTLTEILKWGDSGLLGKNITNVVQIDADRYLATLRADVSYQNVLLTKTSVAEIPEKEIIIIASLFPTDTLRESVAAFNQSSDRYFVTIETYGAGNGDTEGAYIRLDSTLVSRNTPDILDLTELDVHKYTDKDMLEDLNLYMEGETIVNRDNYLSNLLDGFTIDGKLVSIPRGLSFHAVIGIRPESCAIENWSIPELMALTQEYPDQMLLQQSTENLEYLLSTFCAPYYLEEFVDWEEQNCSFDSTEFCSFLDWVYIQNQTDIQLENALFQPTYIRIFEDYLFDFLHYGESMTLYGLPSVDGTGKYTAQTLDTLGILSSSSHKDGAWEFMRFFLTEDVDAFWFPTRLDLLEKVYLDAVTPGMSPWTYYVNGAPVECYALEPKQADIVMQALESIDFTPRTSAENSIIEIIWEEAQYLFDGSKTTKAVAQSIQNRAALVLQE